MSEVGDICTYEETILEVTRATIEDEVEQHPDFADLTLVQQERVRQWGLMLVAAGFQTAMGLRKVITSHRSALLANTAAFLDDTAVFAGGHEEKLGAYSNER